MASIQDPDVAEPRVRLRLVLSLLRVLAGRRGTSRLRWSGAGFVYELRVVRGDEVPLSIDDDPTAENRAEARARLIEELGP